MYASSLLRRALLSLCCPLAVLALTSGLGCPSVDIELDGPPVVIAEPPGTVVVIEADAFGIDLINDTVLEVDPGVFVDEYLLDLGILEPLEGSDLPIPFDIDCYPGDVLTIDPVLYLPGGVDLLAANGPVVLEEGFDYFCGDIITLDFVQDNTGTFFVDVFVNDVLIN